MAQRILPGMRALFAARETRLGRISPLSCEAQRLLGLDDPVDVSHLAPGLGLGLAV